MYPVERSVKNLLYDGFSKEEKGRRQYMRQRQNVIPENKYRFPLCSSWDYGWRLEDAIPKEAIRKPEFGSISLVHDTFYTRNGIPQYHRDRYAKESDARARIFISGL